MRGIDAIIDRILAQASEQVREIGEDAAEQAQLIIVEAHKEAERILLSSAEQDRSEKDALLLRERSLAISESRKIMLSAKQELISKVLVDAVTELKNMDRSVKKELYLSALKKHIKGGETVGFASDDTDIGKELESFPGLDFHTDSKTGDFSGGIIIYRDQVEINMTFEMIISQNRTELVSIAASELFGSNDQ